MVLPTTPESPADVAEKLLASPDDANPATIAALIGKLGGLQDEALSRLESAKDRGGRSLSLNEALGNFVATGPILGYGRLIAELRQLYKVKA